MPLFSRSFSLHDRKEDNDERIEYFNLYPSHADWVERTRHTESIIAKFPVVLGKLEKKDMSPSELYRSVKRQVTDIREFMDIMDCLYALKKVELNGEVIHYVG